MKKVGRENVASRKLCAPRVKQAYIQTPRFPVIPGRTGRTTDALKTMTEDSFPNRELNYVGDAGKQGEKIATEIK